MYFIISCCRKQKYSYSNSFFCRSDTPRTIKTFAVVIVVPGRCPCHSATHQGATLDSITLPLRCQKEHEVLFADKSLSVEHGQGLPYGVSAPPCPLTMPLGIDLIFMFLYFFLYNINFYPIFTPFFYM